MAAVLGRMSEEQLVTLLRRRPDLVNPPPRDLANLAARASTWPSIVACTATLNQASRHVIEALCLLPQVTTLAVLATVLGDGTTADELEPTVDHLESLALVVRTAGLVRLHPELFAMLYPANLGPPIAGLLGTQQVGGLQKIARQLGVTAGRTKVETIAIVARAVVDPSRIKGVLSKGPKGTVELAARLADGPPLLTVPGGTYYFRADTPIGWLASAGLVVTTGWDSVVMPGEVGLALRGGRPFPDFSVRPPAVRWVGVDAEVVEAGSSEQALQLVADLGAILAGWEETPPKLLKSGGLGVREVRRAAALTGRSETEAARLIELAAVAGLAGWDSAEEYARPRFGYDAWLSLDAARRWGAVVAAWLESQVHVNLAGAIGTNQKPIAPLLDRWPEEFARERRRLVLEVLAEGDRDQAAELASLRARAEWDAPTIWSGGPARPEMLVSWVREEADMLGLSTSGALGAIGRLAVRGEISAAVDLLAERAAPVVAEFVIQADLSVVATGQLPMVVRGNLELMADLESAGVATVFRLSERSLRRAFDAGWSQDEIIGFLHAHASRGVPQPLSYLVEDMGRRHGRVRVGTASCYLRSDDPALLAEILASRRSSKLEFRQLAPTVLLSPASPEAVVEVLRATGYLPAREDATGAVVIAVAPKLRAQHGHPVFPPPPSPSQGAAGPPRAGDRSSRAGGGPGAAGGGPGPVGGGPGTKGGGPGLAGGGSGPVGGGPGTKGGGSGPVGGGPGTKGGGPGATGGEDVSHLVDLARRLRGNRPAAGPGRKQAPASRPDAPKRPAVPAPIRPVPPPVPSAGVDPDGLDRPSHIAGTWETISELLTLAYETEWMVRIEYTNQKGRHQQMNVAVLDLNGTSVIVGPSPVYAPMTLAVSRIRWARMLTEAEEEVL